MSADIQKTIYAALTGNATLMASVNGVFDHPNDSAALPIVTIGESDSTDAGTKTEDLIDHVTIINVWHDGLNFSAVKLIQDKIRDVLHRQTLSAAAGTVVYCFEEYREVIPENDGETRGIQRFKILYQYD